MNAFAATESDLALRIRRALGGGARRMGTRARVLAVILLCPLAVVTLPSCGTTSKVSKVAAESSKKNIFIVVDQDGNMKLNDKPVTFATLKEELQAKRQLLDNTTLIIIQGDEARHAQSDRPDHGYRPPIRACRSGHRHGTANQRRSKS